MKLRSVSITEVLFLVSIFLIQNFLPDSYKELVSQQEPKKSVLPIATVAVGEYVVSKVVDGDTITVMKDGKLEKIRLIGIDTPETVDPRKAVQCFGREASLKMKELVDKKKVRLVSDPSQDDKDKYQRLLRYVYLEDGLFVNKTMIQEGYAYEYTYNIPYQYQAEFKTEQENAKVLGKGLWKKGVCPAR